ncbi:hypothetical protein ACEZCY_04660 [Streptacidiphilus sp. N1-12]|uniref:Uncharacterized protein n=2 Tax=Streptacidiphilus alkalitolerans TaxID=3342712 RepID=A0ABV6V4C2_9ACTN
MAIVFMMAVNFGSNAEAARAADQSLNRSLVLTAGSHRLSIYHHVSENPDSNLLTVWTDYRRQRIRLTFAELSEVGHQLYDLLATFHGYTAAACGVEADGDVAFLDELTTDAHGAVRTGGYNGLVLTEAICDHLGLDDTYVPFRPGYRWNPYSGEEPDEGLTPDSLAGL